MSALIVVLYVVIVISALFLILLVVAQSNKGSDLGLFGGSAEMVFGSGQMHAIARITMTCAFVMLLCVFLVGFLKSYSTKSLHNSTDTQGIVVSTGNTTTSSTSKQSGEQVSSMHQEEKNR